MDEKTDSHSHLATQIEADASDKVNITSLSEGWYYVENMTAILENELTIYGNVVLILGNSGNLTITGGINIPAGSSLTIYDGTYYAAGSFQGGELIIQDEDMTVDGALIINSASVFKVDNVLIAGSGSVSINNGSVDIFAIYDTGDGVRMSDVSILGGRVTVKHLTADKLTLGYKTEDDQINITDNCDVELASIAEGCVYVIDGYFFQGSDVQINTLVGKQLEQPAVPLPDGFTDLSEITASITLKTGLTYTTEPQSLAEYEPLSSDYGKLVFFVADEYYNGDWADEPMATAIGTYSISYMIESTNPIYKDSESEYVGTVSIVAKDGVTFTDNTIKYYIYDETNKYVEVIGWEDENYNDGDDIEIQIPATVSKDDVVYEVRKIGANAFSYLKGRYEYGYLKTVVFAENSNIISIGANAFSRNKLASINLGACTNLTTIGHGAFGYCSDLTSVSIPDGVTELADGLFMTSTNLTSVTFSNVTKIGTGVFRETSLESVDLAGVTEIGSMAFNQSHIKNLTIPASVKSIGGEAFESCTYLESITFAANGSLTEIQGSTFNGAGNEAANESSDRFGDYLTVVVPSNITTIGDNAFANAAIQKITFEEGVTTFGNGVFAYISGMNEFSGLDIEIKAANPILGDAPFGDNDFYVEKAKEKGSTLTISSCADRDAIKEAWGDYFDDDKIIGGFNLDETLLPAFTKEYDGDNEIMFNNENITKTGAYTLTLYSATLWDANNMPSPTVGKDKTVKINYDITLSGETDACRTGATTKLKTSTPGSITITKKITIYPNSNKNITIEGVTSDPGTFTELNGSTKVSATYQNDNQFNVQANDGTPFGEYTLTSNDGTVTIIATVPDAPLQASYTGIDNPLDFYNLKDALEYAGYPEGEEITITQVDDYEEELDEAKTINITKKFTLKLSNGKNFDISYLDRAVENRSYILEFSINENASLTINAPSTAKFENVRFTVKGTLTINDGDYTVEGNDCVIVVNDPGEINITDGKFVSKSDVGCILVNSKANISGGYFESYGGFPLSVGSSAEVKLSGGTFIYSGLQSEISAIFNGHDQPHSILEDGYQMYDNTGEPIDEVYGNGARGLIIYETDAVVTEVTVGLKRYTFVLPEGFTAYDESDNEITYATEGQKVTLKYSGTKVVKEVKVYPIPTSISITQSSSTTLSVGNAITLTTTISPAEGIADEDKVVTWSSSDEAVATVSEDGEVTAVAAGEATITASTTNGKTATIEITVQ